MDREQDATSTTASNLTDRQRQEAAKRNGARRSERGDAGPRMADLRITTRERATSFGNGIRFVTKRPYLKQTTEATGGAVGGT